MDDFALVRDAGLHRIRKEIDAPRLEAAGDPRDQFHTQEVFVADQIADLDALIDPLESAKGPEEVWDVATHVVGELASKRFLLENLIEAVKRDASLLEALQTYEKLGLLKVPSPLATAVWEQEGGEPRGSPFVSSLGGGRTLRWLLTKVNRVAVRVFELAVAALRELTAEVSATVTPSVGFAGPVPTFAVEFDLSISVSLSRRLFDGVAAMTGAEG